MLVFALTVLVERSVIFGARTTKLSKELRIHIGTRCICLSMPITRDGWYGCLDGETVVF